MVFKTPTPLPTAIEFVEALRSQPTFAAVAPGPRHWKIFTDLCSNSGARGNLVADAYHAALAIEWGCEWVTADGDYHRFQPLPVIHPLHEG